MDSNAAAPTQRSNSIAMTVSERTRENVRANGLTLVREDLGGSIEGYQCNGGMRIQ